MKTALFAILALLAALVPGRAATLTWTGGGNNDNWSTAANWGGIVPSPGDTLIFTTTSRLINTNNFSPGTAFNGITFEVPAGNFVLNGNPITLGGDILNNQFVTLQTIGLPLALSATRNVDVTADGALTISGVISGAGGLTKTGAGLLTLGAANTFGGALTVNAGTVGVGSDANLGAAPASATAGKIALNNGTLRATSSFSINANRGITLGGEGTFEVGNGITLSYGGAIAGSGGLSKLRFGGLTLSGGNIYSGPTAVKNGSLTLDFAQAASPVNNVINPNSALSIGGATAGAGTTNFAALIMNGKADTANAQTFNGTTIALGQAQIRANSAGTGSARIALGALNRDLGGVVNIIPPRLIGGNGDITTTAGIENGIIGGWAMVSDGTVALQNGGTGNPIPPAVATNFATVDASGNVIAYTDYTEYAGGNLGDIAWGTNNIRIGSDLQGDVLLNAPDSGTTHDVNTITFSRGFDWGLNIGQGNTLRLGRRGALFSQHRADSPTWGITSSPGAVNGAGHQDVGTLTAGGAPDTPGEIIIHLSQAGSGSTDNMVIDCKVTDNGTGPVSIVKAGPGFFKLRGHNTYSGGTYVLQGRIQLSGNEVGTPNPDGIGTGPLYIFPGGYLFFAGGGSPITNKMYIAGDAARQEQGIGAIRTATNWRVDGEVELIGDSTIGGNGQLSGGIAGRITGPYSLTLCSGGTVNGSISISNPNNDWTGNTIIQARNNQGANTFSSGGDECIPHGFGKGNVAMLGYSTGTITWNLNGFSETINGLSTPGNGPTCTILNNGGALSTLSVGGNDQSGTFGGLINNGSGIVALTKIGGGKQTITGANTYSGTTTVQGGTLALGSTGSIPSSQQITVTGGTLDVTDVTGGFAHAFPISLDNGTLALRNTVAPGLASLSMTNSRIRVTSVGSTPVTVDTTVFTTGGDSNVIDIASVGNVSGYPAQFTVIKYAGFIDGAGFNFVLGNVPTASTVGYISNNVANASVDLVLLDGPKALFWTGTANNNWDINTSVNWRAFGVTPSVFLDVDLVRFDDTAGASIVNLTTTVLPSAVTVSNEVGTTYTFTGPGKISGPTGLTKDGAGTLILDNSGTNDFFGPFTINAGGVQVGDDSANGSLGADGVINNANLTFARSDNATIANPISGTGTITQEGAGVLTLSGNNSAFIGFIVVANSTLKAGSSTALGDDVGTTDIGLTATLDVNGQNLSTEPVIVHGSGVDGKGALVNTGPDQLNAFRIVSVFGDAVFGGTSRWDIRTNAAGAGDLTTGGNPHKITKVGSNQVSLVGVNVDSALGDIDIQEGTFSVQTTTSQVGDPNAALTVHGGATLGLFNLNANPLNKAITLRQGATLWNESGISVVNGQIILEGTAIINAASAGTTPSLNVNAEFAGPGGLIKIGSGAMVMAGPFNAYTGPTVVSNGTLFVDGNYSDITTGSFTVHGGTLGGTGAITAPVVINLGGALAPGGLSVPVATLTFGNTLSLAGATRMDVNKTGGVFVNDFVFGVTTLQLGGTLQLNVTGEPLVVGDVVSLFNFNSASGSFNAITPSTPGPGLVWDTSNLAVGGTLAVAAFTSRPEFGTVLQSAGAIVMNGSNGPPGATYYVLSSTNIATPLNQWLPVLTNAFDASGNFSATNLIDPATPQRFFLLQTPVTRKAKKCKMNFPVPFRIILGLAAVVCAPAMFAADALTVASPDNKLRLAFSLQDGGVAYAVTFNEKPVIESSSLKVIVDDKDLTQGVEFGKGESSQTNEKYPWRGVHSEAVNHCNGLKIPVTHKSSATRYAIEARAFNDAVAFRHIIAGGDEPRVPDEATSFRLPAGSTVWSHDLGGHYEDTYEKKDVGEIAAEQWAAPPVTFKLPGNTGYGSITEAALFNYSGMALQADGKRGFNAVLGHKHPISYPFRLRYSNDIERVSRPAALTGAITSPWRVIMFAADLNALVNCDAVHNLCPPADPKLFPNGMKTDWVKAGRAVWKYLDRGANTFDEMKAFSRMAGELGFEYHVIEGFWSRWPDEQLKELADYSRQRGVGLILWKHSRQLRTPEARDEFFNKLQQAGAAGAKIDFFDHEHKEVVDLYTSLLSEAARRRLIVNFHGANKPTGESRTFPNELIREAVRGMEASRLQERAVHNATLPFTRFLSGHADYTPVHFGARRGDTTWAHQIATAAVFTEPLLTYGAHPTNLLANPAVEMIKSIPAAWDETIVLPPSEIGEVAAFARRSGDKWFLAIINGPTKRTIKVPLAFLRGGARQAFIVRDAPNESAAVKLEDTTVQAKDSLTVDLGSGGGFIARFETRSKTP